MATSDSKMTNPQPAAAGPADLDQEREQARRLATRYRCGFIDLMEQRIDPDLFRTIPADLMFRYNFVPLAMHGNTLVIAVADPSQVILSDELPLLLGKKLAYKVATPRQIGDLLKRTEQSQRVLEQATEAFTLQVAKDEEETEETISGDRLTRDTTVSPVVLYLIVKRVGFGTFLFERPAWARITENRSAKPAAAWATATLASKGS